MIGQGRCVLSADGSAQVSDRLAGWQKLIAAESVRQVLDATGRVGQRAC